MLSGQEASLLHQFSSDPYSLKKSELDELMRAVNREKADKLKMKKHKVRAFIASKFNWRFALDGGFMPKEGEPGYSQKYWQDFDDPFSKVWRAYENLVIALQDEYGWSLEEVDKFAQPKPL